MLRGLWPFNGGKLKGVKAALDGCAEFVVTHALNRRNIHVDILRQDRGDDLEIILRAGFPYRLNDVGAVREPIA